MLEDLETNEEVRFGTGCASNAAGWTTKEINAEVQRMAKEAAAAKYAAERKRAADEDAAWGAFLTAGAGHGDRISQIRALGGFSAARAAYRLTQTP